MAKKIPKDPVMKRVEKAFQKSGMTLESLGEEMGYPKATARMSAWQFISRTADPRLSMLRRFAKAIGIPIEELLRE